MFSVLRFTRYFTHFGAWEFNAFACKMKRRSQNATNNGARTQSYKTGVDAAYNFFLRPKIRALFVARNAFFSELIFMRICHVFFLSFFTA